MTCLQGQKYSGREDFATLENLKLIIHSKLISLIVLTNFHGDLLKEFESSGNPSIPRTNHPNTPGKKIKEFCPRFNR